MSSINSHTKKVSVVMCTYNGEAFVEEQLVSIINQAYAIHEIIIVDDCSTDKTTVVIEKLAGKNPLISLYKNDTNLGFNRNFEKAITLASGDIIAIADQDDVWDRKKIEVLMEKWPAKSLLIYCKSVRFRKVHSKPKLDTLITPITGNNPMYLAIRNTVSGHAMMIKKEILQLALPFDANIYYDWWLAMIAVCNGGITYIPLTLVYQRDHGNNVTLKRGLSKKEKLCSYKKVVDVHLNKFVNIPNLTSEHKAFFKKLYTLWHRSVNSSFNPQFFFFLMKNRKAIFKYKNRKFPFISHLKHSWRYAFNKN